jgi:hypothetical protein
MPNHIRIVAAVSLTSALIFLLPGGRGSAAPKLTHEECEIDYKVCVKGCKGPAGDLGPRCTADCDFNLVNCHSQAPDKGAGRPNKAGNQSPPSGSAKPNAAKPKKGFNGTPLPVGGKWVPTSPSKGLGGTRVPPSGTWNPSSSSGGNGPILKSRGGQR